MLEYSIHYFLLFGYTCKTGKQFDKNWVDFCKFHVHFKSCKYSRNLWMSLEEKLGLRSNDWRGTHSGARVVGMICHLTCWCTLPVNISVLSARGGSSRQSPRSAQPNPAVKFTLGAFETWPLRMLVTYSKMSSVIFDRSKFKKIYHFSI